MNRYGWHEAAIWEAEVKTPRSKNPKKSRGGDRRADNPLKFGLQSKRILLPWEQETQFEALRLSLAEDLSPQGVIEMHLVDELANIIWRKQRIGPAESVAFYSGMGKPSPTMAAVGSLAPGQMGAFVAEQSRRLEKTRKILEGDEEQGRELMHQDLGPKVDAEQLVLLGRYEAHLDRKFQRILTMLITLQRARIDVEVPIRPA